MRGHCVNCYATNFDESGYCDGCGSHADNVRIPSTKEIRRELAILIKMRLAEGVPNAVNHARQEINLKYGKGWREQLHEAGPKEYPN